MQYMVQIQWWGHAEEGKGEEDLIRRGLSKLQPMAVTYMHVAHCSAPIKLYYRWLLIFFACEFSAGIHVYDLYSQRTMGVHEGHILYISITWVFEVLDY